MLTHNPAHWEMEVADNTNIGLTLSGHTHAMQVETNLFGWKWSRYQFRYELWGGYFNRLNKQGRPVGLYVNIGAGEVGMLKHVFSVHILKSR